MTIMGYERIWVRGLTPLMRQQLIQVALNEGQQMKPVHGNSAKALRNRGYITEYPYRLTDEGRALVSVNAGYALMEAGQAGQSDADIRARLAASAARAATLESALQEIAKRAPDIEPVDDPDYGWDALKERRDLNIASANFTYGDEIAWWQAAGIARKALKDGK